MLESRRFTRHEPEQLKNFILPSLETTGTTLEQALELLREAYLDACFKSHEKPLPIRFTVRDNPNPSIIKFKLTGIPFLTCLRHLAALSGLSFSQEGSAFVLYRNASADAPTQCDFANHPSIRSTFLRRFGKSPDSIPDWDAVLRSHGILTDATTQVLELASGGFQIRGSAAEIERVKSAFSLTEFPPSMHLKYTVRSLSTTREIDISKTTLTPDELNRMLAGLTKENGTRQLTHPSVMNKEGNSTSLEMIRETGPLAADWSGLKIRLHAGRTGLKITAAHDSEFRPDDGNVSGWKSSSNFAAYPGEASLLKVSSGKETIEYLIISTTAIDATGRPTDIVGKPEYFSVGEFVNLPSDGYPSATPIPSQEGFVISPHSGSVIDTRGIASGTLVADPTIPSENRMLFVVP